MRRTERLCSAPRGRSRTCSRDRRSGCLPEPLPLRLSHPEPQAARREPTTARLRERGLVRLGVVGAILAFVMLAMLYVYATPTYRPPDEASHVAYARELGHGRLPTLETPLSSGGDPRLRRLLSGRDAQHRTIWTANHPPLYYALAALPFLVLQLAPGQPQLAVAATGLVALVPSFIGTSATVYNDSLAFLTS